MPVKRDSDQEQIYFGLVAGISEATIEQKFDWYFQMVKNGAKSRWRGYVED